MFVPPILIIDLMSGNFRLIKSIGTSNKIMDYYNKIPLVKLLESINETEFTPYKTVAVKIFNPAIYYALKHRDEELDSPSYQGGCTWSANSHTV